MAGDVAAIGWSFTIRCTMPHITSMAVGPELTLVQARASKACLSFGRLVYADSLNLPLRTSSTLTISVGGHSRLTGSQETGSGRELNSRLSAGRRLNLPPSPAHLAFQNASPWPDAFPSLVFTAASTQDWWFPGG